VPVSPSDKELGVTTEMGSERRSLSILRRQRMNNREKLAVKMLKKIIKSYDHVLMSDDLERIWEVIWVLNGKPGVYK
jgi:hypothetical protein